MRRVEEPARGSESDVGLRALGRWRNKYFVDEKERENGLASDGWKTRQKGRIVLRQSTRVSARWPGWEPRKSKFCEVAWVPFFVTKRRKWRKWQKRRRQGNEKDEGERNNQPRWRWWQYEGWGERVRRLGNKLGKSEGKKILYDTVQCKSSSVQNCNLTRIGDFKVKTG